VGKQKSKQQYSRNFWKYKGKGENLTSSVLIPAGAS
jgi:hypothetical protein